MTVRADAGFFSYDMIAAIGAHNACYSITIPHNACYSITIPHNAKVKAAIDDDAWASIEYTRGGEAQVAESTIEAGRRGDKLHGDDDAPAKLRLIVRRSRLLGAQGELWPNWRYHCFVTDREDLDTCAADTYHRGHATVELAIRDLKEGSGLSRCPSRTVPRQRRLARLLRARAQLRPLDRPPRPRASSPSQPPSATGSSPCRAASSTTAAATDCACPSTGHGQTPSPPPCNTSATCPCSSDPPLSARRGAAQPQAPPTRHKPRTPVPHAPKRTKTPRPAHTHQPSGPPAPNADPTNPSVDSGLAVRSGDTDLSV